MCSLSCGLDVHRHFSVLPISAGCLASQDNIFSMRAFGIAAFFVFLAEMGDKTQLVALLFATRYRALTVLAGVFVATFLVHLVSVGLGEAAGTIIPAVWIRLLSGIAFIAFGIWSFFGDKLNEEAEVTEYRLGPFMTVAATFFIAELGDKTMLTTITIAGEQRQFVAVWLGSTVGMVVADGIAIAVAESMRKRLPEKALRYTAAAIFIVSGIVTILTANAG
jgi:putative Ca2+/H+ antiporter (TMEM165/GDT1 family)